MRENGMATYSIYHADADYSMRIDADSAGKAKYKNFLDWREALGGDLPARQAFRTYLRGIESCKKMKFEEGGRNESR